MINNILRTFVQYEARCLEQAVITAVQPDLNTITEVFIQPDWNPNNLLNPSGRAVDIICMDTNEVISVDSLRMAERVTNVHFMTIQKYLNYESHSAFSDLLGCRVRFVDLKEPMNEGVPHTTRGDEVAFPDVDYSVIPGTEVWAYDADFNKISVHTSANDAAKAFDISKRSVLYNINRRFATCILGGITVKILFTRNPNTPIGTPNTTVIILDTLMNCAYFTIL